MKHLAKEEEMSQEWRLVDLYVDLNENSAFLNPAIQRARTEGKVPDTVTFCSLRKIGISLGFYPDPEKDINLDYCRAHDISVTRRLQPYYVNVGYPGFFVAYIIVGKNFMPPTVAEIFKMIISPMAEEFNWRWGIKAQYRPFNDMEVGGRKICWMGGSFFGDVWSGASVFLYKPSPIDKINPALNIPAEKFADKEAKSAGERAVSVEELVGRPIGLDEVREAYQRSLERIFGVKLVLGRLTEVEMNYEQENRMKYSPEILLARTEGKKFGPIPPGVKRGETIWKVPRGGLIRAVALVKEGNIHNLLFSGNLLCSPVTALEEVEECLRGTPAEEKKVKEKVRSIYEKPNYQFTGTTPDDLVRLILEAVGKAS
jgi:lipoate-protein ligase A